MGSQLANAQWVQPTPKTSELTTEDSVFIYNAAQKRWFGRGEAWTTQLILTDGSTITNGAGSVIRSMLVKLEDGNYQITSNPDGGVSNSNGQPVSGTNTLIWRQPNDGVMGNVMGCFTDGHLNGDKAGHLEGGEWVITATGKNNSYTIAAPAGTENVTEGMVLGYVEGHESKTQPSWGLYYDVTYAGNEANCEYQFVKQADFDAYATEYARYEAAQTLKSLIDEAADLGIDVSKYQVVYENTGSTLEALNEAIASVRTDIGNNATWEHPQDVTNNYITNPNPVVNIDGYDSEVTPNSFDKGNNCAEFWGNDSFNGAEIKQTMHGLPSGVYTLTMTALTRTGFDSKFFVGSDSVQIAQVEKGTVNSRGQANTWFNEGNGQNTISFYTLGESSDVTFGWRVAHQSDYWTVWRGFELKSYGTKLESFQHLSETFAGEWEEEFADATYCDNVYAAVSEAIEKNQTAATKEDAVAAFEATKKALNDLRLNVQLLIQLQNLVDELDIKNYDEYEGALTDVLSDANVMLSDLDATNEEIQAMIDKLHAEEQKAIDENAQPGADITNAKVKNPTFSEGGTKEQNDEGGWYATSSEGWKLIGGQNGQNRLNGTNGVAESWHGNFDASQPITLAKGAYELKVRGFYRTADDPDYNTPYQYWKEANGEDTGNNTVRAEIYAGANASKFVNVFKVRYTEEQKEAFEAHDAFAKSVYENDSCFTPNNQNSVREALKSPNYGPQYETSVKFIARGTDKPVTIGLRAQNILPSAWTIWDNVQLIFTGRELADLQDALNATVAYNEDLVNKSMAAATKTALQQAINSAKGASTEDAIFAAEEALETAVPAANASVVKYDSLATAKANLDEAVTEYEATAAKAVLDAAKALQTEVAAALTSGSINDGDIAAKIAEINTVIAKLRIPDVSDATMANPREMTSVIVNPTFADDNGGSAEGWTYTGSNSDFVNTHIAQTWNQDADIYQTIENLPKGLYQVLCQGFYMYGTYANDTAAVYYDDSVRAAGGTPDSLKINGYLFANGDSVALQHIIFCPRDVDNFALVTSTPVDDQWLEFTERGDEEGTVFYIPSNRAEAANRFQTLTNVNSTDLNHDGNKADPAYLNSVYCYVDESGRLTLGFFNHSHVYRDWTAATNFQLFYFGDGEDTKGVAGTTGINDINNNVVNGAQQFFTVDGRQVSTLQRGVNIVKTTGLNGKTIVKKVIKK